VTPAERAVIDAALRWHAPSARWCGPEETDLTNALDALLAERERQAAGENEFVWVLRTWRDVRAGDVVRPPAVVNAEVTIETIALQRWHVDPRGSKYSPVPLEHEYLAVRARGWPEVRQINPDAYVEIMLEARELAAIEAFGEDGWKGRESSC
jgi:hypothetical protein